MRRRPEAAGFHYYNQPPQPHHDDNEDEEAVDDHHPHLRMPHLYDFDAQEEAFRREQHRQRTLTRREYIRRMNELRYRQRQLGIPDGDTFDDLPLRSSSEESLHHDHQAPRSRSSSLGSDDTNMIMMAPFARPLRHEASMLTDLLPPPAAARPH